MKGSTKVLATLNALLADELAARDQYFLHAEMLYNWGFNKLADRIAHEVQDETAHAKALIARILMLDGKPKMVPSKISIGTSVPDMLKKDLAVELMVVANLRKAIALCESESDFVTRDILCPLLEDTEIDHAHWLEQQLGLIDKVGLEDYQQSLMAEMGS